MRMQNYLFDSCVMIAFFQKEAGAEKVKSILTKAANLEVSVLMHNASVVELYYDAIKSAKQEEDLILQSLYSFPISFIDNITVEMIKWMGYFKTSYKISFADTFVLATAKINDAKVVTSDHHEFDGVEKNWDVVFEWIR